MILLRTGASTGGRSTTAPATRWAAHARNEKSPAVSPQPFLCHRRQRLVVMSPGPVRIGPARAADGARRADGHDRCRPPAPLTLNIMLSYYLRRTKEMINPV